MRKAAMISLWMALCGLSAHAQTLAENARVIGNELGTQELTMKELRRAMRGEYALWPESKNSVTVVLNAMSMEEECSQTAEFVVASPRPAVLQKYWLGKVFEGRANPPVFVRSEAELIEEVASTPGAVGIVYNAIPSSDLRIQVIRE
ncbi:MAG: hypothetical protein ACPF8U_07625 [Flavobacteriales bacterium]